MGSAENTRGWGLGTEESLCLLQKELTREDISYSSRRECFSWCSIWCAVTYIILQWANEGESITDT